MIQEVLANTPQEWRTEQNVTHRPKRRKTLNNSLQEDQTKELSEKEALHAFNHDVPVEAKYISHWFQTPGRKLEHYKALLLCSLHVLWRECEEGRPKQTGVSETYKLNQLYVPAKCNPILDFPREGIGQK